MTTDLDFSAPNSPEPAQEAPALPVVARNDVAIAGLIAEPAEERELAGGALAVRWTLRVPREVERGGGGDLIDCVALDPEFRERALLWEPATPLEVWGAIRRRFFRTGGRTATRVEVEVFRVAEGEARD
jgi:single-strand DNA-binding protein